MLRVEDLGLAVADAEERRRRTRRSPSGIAHAPSRRPGRPRPADAGAAQLLVGEEADRLHPVAQVAPELLHIAGAGEAAGHADDRDRASVASLRHPSMKPPRARRPCRAARRRSPRSRWSSTLAACSSPGAGAGEGRHRRAFEDVTSETCTPSSLFRRAITGSPSASCRRGRRSCRARRPARSPAGPARPRRCRSLPVVARRHVGVGEQRPRVAAARAACAPVDLRAACARRGCCSRRPARSRVETTTWGRRRPGRGRRPPGPRRVDMPSFSSCRRHSPSSAGTSVSTAMPTSRQASQPMRQRCRPPRAGWRSWAKASRKALAAQ